MGFFGKNGKNSSKNYSKILSEKKEKKDRLLEKMDKTNNLEKKAKMDSKVIELNKEMDEILDERGILGKNEGPKF